MTRIARCRKKPVEQCDLARDEDFIEIASLDEYGCTNENCALYFVDEGGEDSESVSEQSSPTQNESAYRPDDLIHRILSYLATPAARIGILSIVVVGFAYFVSVDEQSVDCAQDPQNALCSKTDECDELPTLVTANAGSTLATRQLQHALTIYSQCGQELQIIPNLREAAEQLDGLAALTLGDIYNPLQEQLMQQVVIKSWTSAYTYYRKAYCVGHPDAIKRGNQLKSYVQDRASEGESEAFELLKIWRNDFSHVNCS